MTAHADTSSTVSRHVVLHPVSGQASYRLVAACGGFWPTIADCTRRRIGAKRSVRLWPNPGARSLASALRTKHLSKLDQAKIIFCVPKRSGSRVVTVGLVRVRASLKQLLDCSDVAYKYRGRKLGHSELIIRINQCRFVHFRRLHLLSWRSTCPATGRFWATVANLSSTVIENLSSLRN